MNETRYASGLKMVGYDGVRSPDEVSWLVETNDRTCRLPTVYSDPNFEVNIIFLPETGTESV
jgi:hypothetical protein